MKHILLYLKATTCLQWFLIFFNNFDIVYYSDKMCFVNFKKSPAIQFCDFVTLMSLGNCHARVECLIEFWRDSNSWWKPYAFVLFCYNYDVTLFILPTLSEKFSPDIIGVNYERWLFILLSLQIPGRNIIITVWVL